MEKGDGEDEVQVAIKGGSMSYALRDVVTYTEKKESGRRDRGRKIGSGGVYKNGSAWGCVPVRPVPAPRFRPESLAARGVGRSRS